MNGNLAARVSAGNAPPEQYATEHRGFEPGVRGSNPGVDGANDVSDRVVSGAVSDYATWFLSETRLLDVPLDRVSFEVTGRLKRSKAVACPRHDSDNGRRRCSHIKLKRQYIHRERSTWSEICETIRHELIHSHLHIQGLPHVHTPRFVWLGKAHGCSDMDRYEGKHLPHFKCGCRDCPYVCYPKQRNRTVRFFEAAEAGSGSRCECGSSDLYINRLEEGPQLLACFGPNDGGFGGVVSGGPGPSVAPVPRTVADEP